MEFVIDTVGDDQLRDADRLIEDEQFLDVEEDAISEALANIDLISQNLLSKNKCGAVNCSGDKNTNDTIDEFYHDMGWGEKIGTQTVEDKLKRKKDKFKFSNINSETGKFCMKAATIDVENIMKNSVFKPGFEKQISLPQYSLSDRKLKALRKCERDKTKGPSWYNMAAPEITDKIKNDLEVLKMRSTLDPKRFYKKNDMEVLPKYFQVGRVVDSPLDHVNERLTNKQRKTTFVDELLANAEFNKYNKKKYKEIIDEKRRTNYKTYMKDKRKKNKQAFKKNKNEIRNKKSKTVK